MANYTKCIQKTIGLWPNYAQVKQLTVNSNRYLDIPFDIIFSIACPAKTDIKVMFDWIALKFKHVPRQGFWRGKSETQFLLGRREDAIKEESSRNLLRDQDWRKTWSFSQGVGTSCLLDVSDFSSQKPHIAHAMERTMFRKDIQYCTKGLCPVLVALLYMVWGFDCVWEAESTIRRP